MDWITGNLVSVEYPFLSTRIMIGGLGWAGLGLGVGWAGLGRAGLGWAGGGGERGKVKVRVKCREGG